MILLQVDMGTSLIGEIAKVGGVPAVLSLCIWWLQKENRYLKNENKELQSELKKEIKSTTAFAARVTDLLEKLSK